MSALTDVQAAFAVTAAEVDAELEDITTETPDNPLNYTETLLAYSVTRAAVVAALTASTDAQAAVAAGHVALDAVLTAVTTLTGDTPLEQLKAARTAFAAVGVAVAALT